MSLLHFSLPVQTFAFLLGRPGDDGRDGQHGRDGVPGNNGIPGRPGSPGTWQRHCTVLLHVYQACFYVCICVCR